MATSVRIIILTAVIAGVIFNSQLTSSMPTGDPILIGKLAIIINGLYQPVPYNYNAQ
jgi:hypothetical protein